MRIILGVVVALIAGLGIWYFATQYGVPQPTPIETAQPVPVKPQPSAEALAAADTRLGTILKEAPEYQAFFQRFKTLYPTDFERFQHDETLALTESSETATPDSILLNAVDNLRKSRGINAAKAGPDMLNRIFDIQARVLDALAMQDARLCDHFLFGGDAPAFADFSKRNRGLIAEMAIAGLEAIADGEAKNVQRDIPTDDDFAVLEKGLTEAGLNAQEISALLDGQMPDTPFETTRVCNIGKTYYAAMSALPPQTKYSIYALAVESMAQ